MQNLAIINPERPRKAPEFGESAVLISTKIDLDGVCDAFGLDTRIYYKMNYSRVHPVHDHPKIFSLAGPLTGAPYAVIVFETLIASGISSFIFFGWCGSISDNVKIGDVIVVESAIIDEGTSVHYGFRTGGITLPSDRLTRKICTQLEENDVSFRKGKIWTTDAIFRETREKVIKYQSRNALAVDMELSSILAVASFRQVEVGAILVVSDELASFTWKPGFKNREFANSRHHLYEVIKGLCRII